MPSQGCCSGTATCYIFGQVRGGRRGFGSKRRQVVFGDPDPRNSHFSSVLHSQHPLPALGGWECRALSEMSQEEKEQGKDLVPGFDLRLSQGQATALDSPSLRSHRPGLENNCQKLLRTGGSDTPRSPKSTKFSLSPAQNHREFDLFQGLMLQRGFSSIPGTGMTHHHLKTTTFSWGKGRNNTQHPALVSSSHFQGSLCRHELNFSPAKP